MNPTETVLDCSPTSYTLEPCLLFLHVLTQLYLQSVCCPFLASKHNHYMTQGLWVIVGLLAFLLLEKMFPDQDSQEDPSTDPDLNSNSAVSISSFPARMSIQAFTYFYVHLYARCTPPLCLVCMFFPLAF